MQRYIPKRFIDKNLSQKLLVKRLIYNSYKGSLEDIIIGILVDGGCSKYFSIIIPNDIALNVGSENTFEFMGLYPKDVLNILCEGLGLKWRILDTDIAHIIEIYKPIRLKRKIKNIEGKNEI